MKEREGFPNRFAWAIGNSGTEEEIDEMEEEWGGEAEGVDAVHETTVTWDGGAPVLRSEVALDGGHDEAAEEASGANEEGDERGLPEVKGGDDGHSRTDQGRGSDSPDEASEGFIGADGGSDLALSQELSPNILEDIGGLGANDKKEQEQAVFALEAGHRDLE